MSEYTEGNLERTWHEECDLASPLTKQQTKYFRSKLKALANTAQSMCIHSRVNDGTQCAKLDTIAFSIEDALKATDPDGPISKKLVETAIELRNLINQYRIRPYKEKIPFETITIQ